MRIRGDVANIIMAFSSFTNRFKNRFEVIGKNGISSLNIANPIEKTEVPESKIHPPLLKMMPSGSKLIISSKLDTDKSQVISSKSLRSVTPYKGLPSVRISPARLLEITSRSKSPLDNRGLHKETSQESSYSCVKLPRIYSGFNHLRPGFKKQP